VQSSPMALDLSRNGRWYLRAPARDFAGLAVQSEMERRGNRRGDRGLLIGVGESLKRQGVNAY
jgi:hypothetical protein